MRILLLAVLVLVAPAAALADDTVWELLRGGAQVVLMRHTITTPGVGAAFRQRSIPVGRVLSSPWCRCLETSRLAFGKAEPWTPLSNLFDNRANEAEQLSALREIAGRRPTGGNLVLVTHGSVVQPLTGIQPAPGEMVVLTPDGASRFRVAGRLAP